jgi:hypothetical protein
MDKLCKVIQRSRNVFWVERRLIPASAKLDAVIVVLMITMLVARAAAQPIVIKPVVVGRKNSIRTMVMAIMRCYASY